MREKVTFPTNTPVFVRLESEPTLAPGRFGDEYQYFLADDKIAWLKPEAHAAVQACGAGPGDEVAITKRETRSGNRKAVAWTAEKVEEEPGAAPPAPAAPPRPNGAAKVNGDAHADTSGPVAVPAKPAAAAALEIPGEAANLFAALKTAIDVAALAMQYAREKGMPLHFDAGDVRALASGLMIERRERRAA
jgi:hypothetical protein